MRRSPDFIVLVLAGLLLVPLVGCGTASRVVRLDTGQGPPLVVTPRSGEPPVRLREGELEASLAGLVREVQPASNPLQHARQLMFGSVWHEEVYLKWTGRRLELDSEWEAAQRAGQACLELTHAYGRWCEHQGRPRDCLSLLEERPLLDADGRYAVAMELALGSVWNETRDAFKDMASPEAVRAIEGHFTLALAPGAVAMVARPGATIPTPSTLAPGPYATESIPARGPGRDFTAAEREAVNEIGRKHGCHTCGSKDPGTKSGDFIPDHQPPSQLAPGQPQRLFPHCKACSRKQGGDVNAELHRK